MSNEPEREAPLPCPFCGGVELAFDEGSTFRWGIASCRNCGASIGEVRRSYPDEQQWHARAIAEWNTRAAVPQALLDAEFERVRLLGMEQERALFELTKLGQEIEAPAEDLVTRKSAEEAIHYVWMCADEPRVDEAIAMLAAAPQAPAERVPLTEEVTKLLRKVADRIEQWQGPGDLDVAAVRKLLKGQP